MSEVKQRLLSLDVFRGLTIAAMVLVNTPGSWSHIYPPLDHAPWHGFTPTDLVFPFFLFAVGLSMSFSFKKFEGKTPAALKKIITRTVLIFLIAYLLNFFPFTKFDFAHMRIMGVLQRIATAYFFASLLCLFASKRNLWIISIIILIGYWFILLIFGTGDPFSIEGNAVLKLDKLILGVNHLWRGHGIPFDPEGLLSTLPAIVTAISGYLAGLFIQKNEGKSLSTMNMFFLYGNGLIFLALVWDMVFPINKSIWTSSYVLMSSGIALVVVSFLIYFIDVKGQRTWIQPFLVMGRNPLILFVLSILIVKIYVRIPMGENQSFYGWFYEEVFVPMGGYLNGSLLFGLFHVFVIWLFGWILYRKNIIIKV